MSNFALLPPLPVSSQTPVLNSRDLWPTSFKTKPNPAPATAAHRGGQCRVVDTGGPGDCPERSASGSPLGSTAHSPFPMLAGGLPDHPTLILHVDRQREATRGTGCGQAVGGARLRRRLLPQVTAEQDSSSAAEIYFLGFGGRRAQISASDQGCSRGPIPGSQMVHILLCPCGVEGTGALRGLFLRGTDPIQEGIV